MQHTISMKENHLFRRLYAKGKNAVSPTLAVYCRKNGQAVSRLGFTVGLKLGHAVTRNKVRRRLREAYRIHEGALRPGYDIVVVARVKAASSTYKTLERSLLQLLGRLDLLLPEEKTP
ncbi:MAG: ribonuclease P protein component [Oscillospiraceae bacterium]